MFSSTNPVVAFVGAPLPSRPAVLVCWGLPAACPTLFPEVVALYMVPHLGCLSFTGHDSPCHPHGRTSCAYPKVLAGLSRTPKL